MTRIARHEFVFNGEDAAISTVKFGDIYETIVMYADGTDIECYRTKDIEQAKRRHNTLVEWYNEMIYNGSVNKLLGQPNVGQLMHTVKAC